MHIFWHRDGILAFFPITPGRWRVIGDLGPATGSGHHADPTLEEVQAMITHRGTPGIKIADPVWLAAFRINERKVKDYRRGRVFLSGDAAHIHSPAGGQGMNTGMQDAFNLAWKLNLVMKGIAKPSLLDSYSTERSAVGDMVLRNAGRMTEAAIARNPAIQSAAQHDREVRLGLPADRPRHGRHACRNSTSPIPTARCRSPARTTPTATKPGRRWPDRLPADTSQSRFTAIGPADATADLAAKFPKLVAVAASSKHADPRDLILVRPDGYVGFAGAAVRSRRGGGVPAGDRGVGGGPCAEHCRRCRDATGSSPGSCSHGVSSISVKSLISIDNHQVTASNACRVERDRRDNRCSSRWRPSHRQ